MSEKVEELIGDAGDVLECFDDEAKEPGDKTKKPSSDLRKGDTLTKIAIPQQKLKLLDKNKGNKKVQPKGDDLLQALSVGAIFTPSIQNVPKINSTSTKQHKSKEDCKPLKEKPQKDANFKGSVNTISKSSSELHESSKEKSPSEKQSLKKILDSDKKEMGDLNQESIVHARSSSQTAVTSELQEKKDVCETEARTVSESVLKTQILPDRIAEDPKQKNHPTVAKKKDTHKPSKIGSEKPFKSTSLLDIFSHQINECQVGALKSKTAVQKTSSSRLKVEHKSVSDEKNDAAFPKQDDTQNSKKGVEKRKSSSWLDVLQEKRDDVSPPEPKYSKGSHIVGNWQKEGDMETSCFTDEDLKNFDQFLVDQMVDNFVKQTTPTIRSSEAKYQVKVSPLEIADLGETTVQNLIEEHPKMSVIFKRQIGKFKKKKGYAEITFTKLNETKEFVRKLVPVKFVERKIEITITAWLSGIPQILSLQLAHPDSHKLVTLIKSGQDPQAKAGNKKSGCLELELVPANVTAPLLTSMFPFSSFARFARDPARKEADKSMHGPVFIHFNNQNWLEAVVACFFNFAIDGCCLNIMNQAKSQSEKDSRKERNEKEQSMRDVQREKSATSILSVKPKEEKGISQSSDLSWSEALEDDEDDDAVSNMTRDVCAGMLESLDNLRQLDANNPNIDRILKMREQLNNLHKSLGPQKKGMKEKQMNPWKVSDEDVKARNESDVQVKRGISDSGSDSTDIKKLVSKSPEEDESIILARDQKRREEEELQRQEEEVRKEEERKRLIRKIEEARQRDLKKAEERAQHRSVWESQVVERRREPSFSPKKSTLDIHASVSGSRDPGFERGNNRSNKRPFEESHAARDDGVDKRLAEFERELAHKGVIQSHSSSKRPKGQSSDGFSSARESSASVPILREDEYENILAEGRLHVLPPDFSVQIQSSLNRQCPVKSCPNTKYFRDINSFMDHWSMFHVPEHTMRFCQRCVAYFMNQEELAMHLKKHHRISPKEVDFMIHQARVKVISNPSFRDPYPYLPPLC